MRFLPALLIILIITFVIFSVLHRLYDYKSTKKYKTIVLFAIIFTIAGMIGDNLYRSSNDEKIRILQEHFKRGEILLCDDIKVSQNEFNLVTGTLTLAGKNNTPHSGTLIALKNCKINT